MKRNQSLNTISILLAITGLVMIGLGARAGIMPPILTGVGFGLIVWAIQVLK